MAKSTNDIIEIVEFLNNYPIKPTPYPPGYPDDLKYEIYPGQDYVIGMCNEAINGLADVALLNRDKDVRDLANGLIDVFKTVKYERLKKLKTA